MCRIWIVRLGNPVEYVNLLILLTVFALYVQHVYLELIENKWQCVIATICLHSGHSKQSLTRLSIFPASKCPVLLLLLLLCMQVQLITLKSPTFPIILGMKVNLLQT